MSAREVSSGPLSETIVAGRPRRAISASSSRTTRAPPIEVSTVRTSASRVKSSTTARSEEHTSELQSLMRNSYAVFCLKINKTHSNTHYVNCLPLHTQYKYH